MPRSIIENELKSWPGEVCIQPKDANTNNKEKYIMKPRPRKSSTIRQQKLKKICQAHSFNDTTSQGTSKESLSLCVKEIEGRFIW